jgi:hypothetical protein
MKETSHQKRSDLIAGMIRSQPSPPLSSGHHFTQGSAIGASQSEQIMALDYLVIKDSLIFANNSSATIGETTMPALVRQIFAEESQPEPINRSLSTEVWRRVLGDVSSLGGHCAVYLDGGSPQDLALTLRRLTLTNMARSELASNFCLQLPST